VRAVAKSFKLFVMVNGQVRDTGVARLMAGLYTAAIKPLPFLNRRSHYVGAHAVVLTDRVGWHTIDNSSCPKPHPTGQQQIRSV